MWREPCETHEAAVNGVLSALEKLFKEGVLPEAAGSLSQVALKWALYHDGPYSIESTGQSRAPLANYGPGRDERARRLREFRDALRAWACRFRLTVNLSEHGEPLEWAVAWAEARCQNRRFRVEERSQPMPPPKPWAALPYPDPRRENFAVWRKRINPELRQAFDAIKRYRPTRSSPKRRPEHYEWFVLRIAGRWPHRDIAKRAGTERVTIEKGVQRVRLALRLNRT
jgi:hypothetical protein